MTTTQTTTSTNGATLAGWGLFGAEAMTALYDLRWMLVLVVVLVMSDFWFGISDSLHRNEHFRVSRAGRRTCNKVVDYLNYLLIGAVLGLAIFEPLDIATHVTTAAVGLGLGCLWEIDSIIGHVCSLHGVESKFSVKKFLISLMKKKDSDLGEALEETLGGGEKRGTDKDEPNERQ